MSNNNNNNDNSFDPIASVINVFSSQGFFSIITTGVGFLILLLTVFSIAPFLLGVSNIYLAIANDYPDIKKNSRFTYLNMFPPLTLGIYQVVSFFRLINFMKNKNNRTKKIKMMKRKYKNKSKE